MSVNVKLNLKPTKQIVKEKLKPESTLMFMGTTWHKLYYPYTPFGDTEQLADNVEYKVNVSKMECDIVHKVPYAEKQWEGVNHNFRKDKHPLATHHPDEAAKAAGKGKELTESVQKKIERG